ncbi:cyclic GMP-AMP synthase DncV-like nucleotidyltransferase [Brevibacillus sp. NPDC003359]|uniref:SMODS domain-containing nucleotidyltransferase n=1 Tax=unclassified Brevibacillus TaxID=2684853 RepID=UPI00369C32D9
MVLNDYFKDFIGEISLNPARVGRIESAISTWTKLLQDDEEISPLFNSFYTQGSYASKTATKPQNNKEFDVDTVLLLNLDSEKEAKESLNWLTERIKTFKAYTDKVISKDRCVRINYAGDFHMDIVLAKPTTGSGQSIMIPSKKLDEWIETNPVGFKYWCNTKNLLSTDMFSRVAKMIKYWRDTRVGKDTAPKSIMLTTLIGTHFVYRSNDAESLVDTLEAIVNNLDSIVQEDDSIYVENPSLSTENLARDWDKSKYDIFKTKLEKFSKAAKEALDESDEEESIKKWNEIFDDFPTKLSEAANVASQIAQGTVLVSSTGALNTTQGIAIASHRFFGGEKSKSDE